MLLAIEIWGRIRSCQELCVHDDGYCAAATLGRQGSSGLACHYNMITAGWTGTLESQQTVANILPRGDDNFVCCGFMI